MPMDYRHVAIAGVDFGVPADGTTDAAPAINTVMADLAARGGGIVDLPMPVLTVGSTLDNCYNRVFLRGSGKSSNHDAGSVTYCTTIVPTFAGTVLKHRSPLGSSLAQNEGGGFTGLRVKGNGIATRLLEIDSIRLGEYDLFLEECAGSYSAVVLCAASGSLAEMTNVYRSTMKLRFRQTTGGPGSACLLLTGNTASNVTACDIDVQVFMLGAVSALEIQDADNNQIALHVYCASGAGNGLVCRGQYVPFGGYARANYFRHIASNAPIVIEGTDTSGVLTPANGLCYFYDTENNPSMPPTIGTGAKFPWIDHWGAMHGFTIVP